ncbi:MAG: NTP transferase domain-containing protein [Saprospiraceae bacterium]
MSNPIYESGIILLAAGASTRLGQPKQLLKFQGETLIVKTIKTALRTPSRPIIVVLGAYYAAIHAAIPKEIQDEIIVVENKDWQQGMSTSVRLGLETLRHYHKNIHSALFLLSDQPLLTTAHLLHLIEQAASNLNSPSSIVASFYNERLGVPAVFDQKWFPELLQLRGDQGARKILEAHAAEVLPIPFPEGAFDIDTPENYDFLIRHFA